MSKGQKGNKEAKKPKRVVPPANPQIPASATPQAPAAVAPRQKR